LGLLDYSQIWVNPTYLWPGILGGLIMGFGFIIGGFCPGTSLVALATLKVDGIFFVFGAVTGIFLFGETVGLFESFWNSSYLGRFTLPEWLGLSTGTVVVLVVFMALFMFWGAEQLERIFSGKDPAKAPKLRFAGAAALVVLALVLMGIGQPTVMDKWNRIAAQKAPLLENRDVYIHPGELAHIIDNDQLNHILIDLRDEVDYNLFHLKDARLVAPEAITNLISSLLREPDNSVFVLMDSNEKRSTAAWKILVAEQVPNVYILDGGINFWLDVYGHAGHELCPKEAAADSETMRHVFDSAMGSKHPEAEPDTESLKIKYTPKLKLETRKNTKKGGCG
jgi:rhodanese-related sulfurtransferase